MGCGAAMSFSTSQAGSRDTPTRMSVKPPVDGDWSRGGVATALRSLRSLSLAWCPPIERQFPERSPCQTALPTVTPCDRPLSSSASSAALQAASCCSNSPVCYHARSLRSDAVRHTYSKYSSPLSSMNDLHMTYFRCYV